MTLQEVTASIADGGLGFQPAVTDKQVLVIGFCSGIAANTVTSVNSADTVASLGYGPGAQAAALLWALGGGPVYVVNPTCSTAGAATAVVQPGGSPPAVGTTGAPYDVYDAKVKIIVGGARATATFKYSLDGGVTWSAEIVTAATYLMPGTNTTLTFATGTYVANDEYTFTTTAPHYSTTNFNTAIDAALADPREWGILYAVGQAGGATNADKVTAAGAMFSAIASKMTTAANAARYARAVMEMPDVLDAEFAVTFAALSDTRMSCVAGFAVITNAISCVGYGTPKSNIARVAVAKLLKKPIGVDPSEMNDEDGRGPLDNVVSLSRDERETPALDAQRFVTARTYVGSAGFYLTNWPLFSTSISDFRYLQHGQIVDSACKVTREGLKRYLSKPLDLNASTGTLEEGQAQTIETDIGGKVRDALVTPGHANAIQVTANRDDNIVTTEKLRVKLRVQPKGYPKLIDFEVALAKSLAA